MEIQMRLAAALVLAAGPAFGDAISTETRPLASPPTEWLGPVPHLVIMGKMNGHDLNLQYTDLTAADAVVEFGGKREYLAGEAGAFRYGDFEVGLKAVIGGVERSFELEFENDDFSGMSLPVDLVLGSENFPKGNAAFLEFAAEWEDASGSVNDEIGGFTGTLSLKLDEGSADDKGLRPDGMIGGLVIAEQAGETVVVSFTVPVAEYEIDD
jgi:hypothetical protein